MRDLTNLNHHPVIEDMVDILCNKTQNMNRDFFRITVSYFLAKVAGSMNATLVTKDRGKIPVNIYAFALAHSGFGKGHSLNIIETSFLDGFKDKFMNHTFDIVADKHLNQLAAERAINNLDTTEEEQREKLDKEFNAAGGILYTFDSGTAAGVKQIRNKLLLSGIGAINLQIDEIGSNLLGNVEVLNLFLELYDQGLVKQKLTKSTNDSLRGKELEGKTPTNALLFGTPSQLLDGGQTEDQFYSFLETGYARRCLFALGTNKFIKDKLTPKEVYYKLINSTDTQKTKDLHNKFMILADKSRHNWNIYVDETEGIELIAYKMHCEAIADKLPDYENIKRAELYHRYFKALKLAGALSFIDGETHMSMDNLYYAINIVETSGKAFNSIMAREKPYIRLAKYIANNGSDLTHADLHEALPFYKSSQSARNEIIMLATAWGYKNGIIIKKWFIDDIEMFSGDTLKKTDINKVSLSYSNHFADNYKHEEVPFKKMDSLCLSNNMHWCNHEFNNGHRHNEDTVEGFNLVVLDVDKHININIVCNLLEEYSYYIHTTKSHTKEHNRFRLVIPIKYHLKLNDEDYKQFINNIIEWLPFELDPTSNQRCKKWETNTNGVSHLNLVDNLLDPLIFVPRTSKNEKYKKEIKSLGSLNNLERWFSQKISQGNRNNQMIKYALALSDSGMSFNEVEGRIIDFNNRLPNSLSITELNTTILKTIAKKMKI